MTMSIADLLDDWFESPQVKGAMAVNGVIGTWAGPYEPGTAYVMAHHSIGDVGDGQLGSWGYPEGGMGGGVGRHPAAAESFGAEVRTDARGRFGCSSKDGRVEGAVLENGDELRAPTSSSRACTRRPPSSTTLARRTCRTTSCATSSAGGRAAVSSRSTSPSTELP